MRKFRRVAAPEVWARNEAKWNQQWTECLQQSERASFSWYECDGQTARELALPHLKEQTQGHCSFCDSFPVGGVSNETIEHFRPKSRNRFPQYAYTWTNLYYCCDACQACKREQWSDALIAPDHEDYEFLRFFEFDFTTGAMRPSSIASEPDRERAKATIATYGLDSTARRTNRRYVLHLWRRGKHDSEAIDEFAYRDYLEVAPRTDSIAQKGGQ